MESGKGARNLIGTPSMNITGLNHITLAVADLDRAMTFYRDLLGARCRAHWPTGAYLELGPIWLCLEKTRMVHPRADDTHIALTCADFDAACARLRPHVTEWKVNRSEGASLYFLDPDGHKLELHAGDLASRLAHYRAQPNSPVTLLD